MTRPECTRITGIGLPDRCFGAQVRLAAKVLSGRKDLQGKTSKSLADEDLRSVGPPCRGGLRGMPDKGDIVLFD
jgi:hypothetical protein